MNTFNSSQAASLNSKLFECVQKSVTGKLMYPKTLWGATEWQDFIHLSWSDGFWGFVDDVYIRTYMNHTANPVFSVMDITA